MFLVEFVRTGVRFSPPPPIRDIMKIKLTIILLFSLLLSNMKKSVEIKYNTIDQLIQLSELNVELDHYRTSALIHAHIPQTLPYKPLNLLYLCLFDMFKNI